MGSAREVTVDEEFGVFTYVTSVTSIEEDRQLVESRCGDCQGYWNRKCTRRSRCGCLEYTPCLHCDLDLRESFCRCNAF